MAKESLASLKQRLSTMLEPEDYVPGKRVFTEEGSRLYYDQVMEYSFEERQAWIDSMPDSPVKEALLHEEGLNIV